MPLPVNTTYMNQFQQAPAVSPYTNAPTPDQQVQGSLEAMLNPNSSYIQNARQRGIEYAASRGGLNSSIAAGASERSAIEAAQPFVSQSLDMQKTRDVLAGQNWLDAQNFNRDFKGKLAMMPITNSMNMLSTVTAASLQDPALFTPDVVSGYTQFFNTNMNSIFNDYFKGGH